MGLQSLLPNKPFSVDTESGRASFVKFINSIGALPKPVSFQVSPENQMQHNLSVATLLPLMPVGWTCFTSEQSDQQILLDKFIAEKAGQDYVEPTPWLVICLQKDKTKAINDTLDKLLKQKAII